MGNTSRIEAVSNRGIRKLIEVSNITKTYGARTVVSNLSFTLPSGGIVGLLGPNGAGKTTTMNLLTGFLAPTAGRICIDGHDLKHHPQRCARHIGFLPEQPPLYTDMTVKAFLGFVYDIKGVRGQNSKAHILETCQQTDIADVSNRVIGHLSRGYRQRVGLAAALIGDPDILVLDEPTIGLDPKQIRDFRALIASLGVSRTVLLSTHILPEVSALCERVLVLNHGVLVADAPPSVLTTPVSGIQSLIRIADGQGTAALAALNKLPDVLTCRSQAAAEAGCVDIVVQTKTDMRPQLLQALTAQNVSVFSLGRVEQPLEDMFLSLTLEDPLSKGGTHESNL